ncbi:MAG: SusC/RagA family TonB-linked outer membrane protein, partial [Bacteroidaceae bacterium]|nr:SusC/RagA family TonB-linked outer membrane protein [Bacteroidaceae bacterium]
MKRLTVWFALLVACIGLYAQGINVRGRVIDEELQEPLPGVHVKVQGTSDGTVTDVDGNYNLQLKGKDKAVLVFSFVGMKEEVRAVTSTTEILNVTLRNEAKQMEEVVAIAYGTRKKGTLAGAVTTVAGEKIETVPAAGFDQALQGRTPGLSIISNSGEPSKPATFQVRGTNSINSGTAPLFILDGVPITASDFNTINPADIETFNVLKDASSTSIYGARAANGVVVITTKRGTKMDRAQVKFSSQWGFSNLAKGNWNLMNTSERIAYEKEIGLTSGKDYAKLSQTDVNWRDIVFRKNAFVHSYSVNVNKATDKLNYYVSANYFDQDGIAQSSTFKRYTLRANTEVKCTKALQVGTNAMFTYEEVEQADDGVYSLYTPISACRFMLPYYSPYNADGSLASSNDGTWKGVAANPIEYMDNNPMKSKKYKALATAYFNLDIYKGLSWRTQLGLDYTHSTTAMKSYPSYVINNGSGTAGHNTYDALNLTITNLLTYKTTIKQNHDLTVMLGQEGIKYSNEG